MSILWIVLLGCTEAEGPAQTPPPDDEVEPEPEDEDTPPTASCLATSTYSDGSATQSEYDEHGWLVSFVRLSSTSEFSFLVEVERVDGVAVSSTTTFNDGRVEQTFFDEHEHVQAIDRYDASGNLVDSVGLTLEHADDVLVADVLSAGGSVWRTEHDACENPMLQYVDNELQVTWESSYTDGCTPLRVDRTTVDGVLNWTVYDAGLAVQGGFQNAATEIGWTQEWDCP